jgi:hypothetical protein
MEHNVRDEQRKDVTRCFVGPRTCGDRLKRPELWKMIKSDGIRMRLKQQEDCRFFLYKGKWQ